MNFTKLSIIFLLLTGLIIPSYSQNVHKDTLLNKTYDELENNSKMRKYTIKAIAEKIGFKNIESFSKAFYKFTNVKPSYFIKELKKLEARS